MQTLNPGATIGILGSGQLGRMMALAAKALGYKVICYSPDADSPAEQVCDSATVASYTDTHALERFAKDIDVATFEFENIPAEALQKIDHLVPVFPHPNVLHMGQNRQREKTYVQDLGIAVTPFYPIHSEVDMTRGIEKLGTPCVLKTADSGYDGKGQRIVEDISEAHSLWRDLQGKEAILEQFIDYEKEISVISTRAYDGTITSFGVIENHHKNHILDVSLAPANVSDAIKEQAIETSRRLMNELDMVGTLCIEFFLTKDGKLLVNELAPRPHNSGHLTIDACVTSQFEQHVRAICGLPLGSTQFHQPAAMVNLMGDSLLSHPPDWSEILKDPMVKLHLYGKQQPRMGRKMGHITVLADSYQQASEKAQAIKLQLNRKADPVS